MIMLNFWHGQKIIVGYLWTSLTLWHDCFAMPSFRLGQLKIMRWFSGFRVHASVSYIQWVMISDSRAKMTYEPVSQSKIFNIISKKSLVSNGLNQVHLVSESFRDIQFAMDSLNEQRVVFRLCLILNESESFKILMNESIITHEWH